MPQEHQRGRAEAAVSSSKTDWVGRLNTALGEPVFITSQVSKQAGNNNTVLTSALNKAQSAGGPWFSDQQGSFHTWGPALFKALLIIPSDCFHSQLPSHLQQGKEQGLVAASPFPCWLCQAAAASLSLAFLSWNQKNSFTFQTPLPFRNSRPHPSQELASFPDSHQLLQPGYHLMGAAPPPWPVTSPISLIRSSETYNTIWKRCFQIEKNIPTGAQSQAGRQPCCAGWHAATQTQAGRGATGEPRVHWCTCSIPWQSTNPGIFSHSPLPPDAWRCREGRDNASRETGAGGPFAAISELIWSSQWWSSGMFIFRTRSARGAQGMKHTSVLVPQHRLLPPTATAIWNKSLSWDSSKVRSSRRNYFISFPLQASGIHV